MSQACRRLQPILRSRKNGWLKRRFLAYTRPRTGRRPRFLRRMLMKNRPKRRPFGSKVRKIAMLKRTPLRN